MARRELVGVLVFAGCSQILGLSAPHEQGDAAGSADAPQQADFSLRVTTLAPRVPQNSFDFIDVAVTPGPGFTGAITVDIPSPPAGVTVTPATIAAGSTTGRVKVAGAKGLTVGAQLALDVVASGGGATHDVPVNAVVTLQPGILDPGYGASGNGIVPVVFLSGNNGFFTDALVGPGNTVIAVGCADLAGGPRGAIARLTAAGDLDTAFGSNGFTLATSDPNSTKFVQLFAVARQSSGNLVTVGQGPDPVTAVASATWTTAFQASGQPDTEFFSPFDDSRGAGRAVVALSDDSLIIVAGTGGGSNDFAISHALAFGAPDPAFNGGSPLPLGFTFAPQLGIAGAGGLATDVGGHTTYVVGAGSAGGVVAHITAAGAFDNAFGSGGVVELGSGAGSGATALAVQDDGNLVVGAAPATVVRLTPTGALDPTFGSGGTADLGSNSFFEVAAIALQGDGKILVGGSNGVGGAVILRLLADGTLDPSYGSAGEAFVGNFALTRLVVTGDGGAIGVGLETSGSPISAAAFRLAP